MTRQAVISIRRPQSDNDDIYTAEYASNIAFRQPFNNLGLALRFSFQKSWAVPYSLCDLSIENVSTEIVESFRYNYETREQRPLIEIRAGYSDIKESTTDLRSALPLIYSGIPYYYVEQKTPGGRILSLNLSDIPLNSKIGIAVKISDHFLKGDILGDVLTRLLSQTKIKYSLAELITSSIFFKPLTTNLDYWNLPLFGVILHRLGRDYGFYSSYTANGTLVFRPSTTDLVPSGSLELVEQNTGLIEIPTKINFVHWRFQTLFGRPRLLYPGEWVRLKAEYFERNNIAGPDGIQGVITYGEYVFDDAMANCTYVLAPNGSPVVANPINLGV